MTLLVNAIIEICACLKLYQWGHHQTFIITSPSFTKHTLLAEAITLSAADRHDILKHLGICAYASKTAGSNSTQWDMI